MNRSSYKSIKFSVEYLEELEELKRKHGFRSYDAAGKYLLGIYRRLDRVAAELGTTIDALLEHIGSEQFRTEIAFKKIEEACRTLDFTDKQKIALFEVAYALLAGNDLRAVAELIHRLAAELNESRDTESPITAGEGV